jgi:urease accessory protein
MRVADTYLGHRSDEAVAARLAREGFETISVDEAERRRSRFRTRTGAGTDLGVTVSRELTVGDVLGAGNLLVVVDLEPVEAMVIDLEDAEDSLTGAVALGHAVGNRHWDMAIRDDAVLFPATESRERMESTVETHLPAGATVAYEEVSPATFDGDGPGHGPGHTHSHDHSHSHDHEVSGDESSHGGGPV